MNRIKIVLMSITIAICCLVLVGCSASYTVIYSIDGYDDFLGKIFVPPSNGGDIADTPPDSSIQDKIHIDRYELLNVTAFDTPAVFGEDSDYTVTYRNQTAVIVDRRGNIFPYPQDFYALAGNYYIFVSSGKYGLKRIGGEAVLEATYRKIEVLGNVFVAESDSDIFIFENERLICTADIGRRVSPYRDDILLCDGILTDIYLKPITFDNYCAVAISDGIATVYAENGGYGYYELKTNRCISAAQYFTASLFVNGVAFVQKELNGSFYVIDTDGKEIAVLRDSPFGYYDGYTLALNGNSDKIKVYDSDFSYTGLEFDEVSGNRVYGGYIVDALNMMIFSVSDGIYVSEKFNDIKPTDIGFICTDKGMCKLYDFDLILAAEFDDIVFSKGVLSVLSDGYYYYFSQSV